jgi:hypothetical protein
LHSRAGELQRALKIRCNSTKQKQRKHMPLINVRFIEVVFTPREISGANLPVCRDARQGIATMSEMTIENRTRRINSTSNTPCSN